MLRKIALSSMKGRKKDTLILSFVIILSFLFIVIATVFHASSEKTKYEQNIAMFGKWDLAYYNGNQDIKNRLLELEDVDKLGVSRIIGRSSTCGNVGTINEELIDLGSFEMYEGRMPEEVDEIALELNQLKDFPGDVKIGDIISVRLDIPISSRDEMDASEEQVDRVLVELEEMAKKIGMEEPFDMIKLYDEYSSEYKRSIQSLEAFNGTEVGVNTNYIYQFVRSERDSPLDSTNDQFEDMKRDGSIVSQRAYITRNMEVTGIFQTYSNIWDRRQYSVANSFITEDTGKHFIERGYLLTKEVDASLYKTPQHLFIDTRLNPEEFVYKYNDDFQNLRINSYLHSDTEDSTENILTYGILLGVFIATIFTVFLIYFTQMKRRARRIALLKSIGATNAQIRKLLIWEVFYFLTMTIPIGVAGGIGIGKIILLVTNKYGKTQLNFYVDYRLTILGVLIGVIAIFVSMLIPMIVSMKIPLTGTISEQPKRKKDFVKFKKDKIKVEELDSDQPTTKIKRKIKPVNLDMKIQTFGRISFKNIKHHKAKHLLTLGLYTITITVLLGCIFLSYLFFQDYINQVIITGRPSYGYEVNYGLTRDEITDLTKELNSIKDVTSVDIYKGGERAFLWYEGIENNKLQSSFKEILSPKLRKEHYGDQGDYVNLDEDNDYLVKDAIVTNIYGVDLESSIYNKFENAITRGSLNKDRFKAGDEVILMIPIYNKIEKGIKDVDSDYWGDILSNVKQKNRMKVLLEYRNLYNITYDFRHSKYYLQDNSIDVGDIIYLTIPTEKSYSEVESRDVAFNEVEVSAIIHYFPGKGIWPFADTVENPVVIGSYNLTEELYPFTIKGRGRMDATSFNYRVMIKSPTRYGRSWVFVDTSSKSFDARLQSDLKKVARNRRFKFHEYKESNDIIFKKAFNFTIIIVILGIAVAIITSVILYNTSLSKLEQERERIGTFQGLGVTRGQFKKQYIITGICYGIISLLLSHIILIIGVKFTTIGNSGPMVMNVKEYINYIIQDQLWLYPWIVHISISIIFFVVAILTYYLPLKKILDNEPIHNIRGLAR